MRVTSICLLTTFAMYSASIPRLKLNLSVILIKFIKIASYSYCDLILFELSYVLIFFRYMFTDDYNKSINYFDGIFYNLFTCFYI